MQFQDIIYEKKDGVAKITINRPEKLNAFRANTCKEMVQAFEDAEEDATVGVVVLTGAGDRAFSAGGDFSEVAGKAGYSRETLHWVSRLHGAIRHVPKPVIAAVNGYAIGGGHVLHVVCDLSIAADTARFGQSGPRVGSYDAGFGALYLARVVGEKKAREMWFLCRQYTAQEALEMGLVNKVVPADKLQEEVEQWCREILALSPTALAMLKQSFNADTDHIYGLEDLAMSSLWLYYHTDEAREGYNAFLEKRPTDFSKFRK